jgi:spore coat protein U-like protein
MPREPGAVAQIAMSHAGGNRRIAFACSAFLQALVAFALSWAAPATAQTCVFNAGQPTVASFGSIDPSLSSTYTFTVTINFKCTASADAMFTITGANDTGPGAYRLRNLAQPAQYMAYSISTAIVPGTRIALLGQLVAANYRDAYVGSYSDTLSVLILP